MGCPEHDRWVAWESYPGIRECRSGVVLRKILPLSHLVHHKCTKSAIIEIKFAEILMICYLGHHGRTKSQSTKICP
jgi:hypothetical protein